MAGASTKSNNRRHIHIPAELVEKILLNLSVKSLVRFSAVSKSWNSIIYGAEFVKRYRGREMMVLRGYHQYSDESYSNDKGLVFPLSSISSENPVDSAIAMTWPPAPSKEEDSNNSYHVHASCDQFWCVELEPRSLYFYNPSNESYRKLPDPLIGISVEEAFIYGLGYDAVSNDYKMLRVDRQNYVFAELYSLTSDSWELISEHPNPPFWTLTNCFSVSGALHWLVHYMDPGVRILSFDLSTKRFGELSLPERNDDVYCYLDITVLRGKFSVCMSYDLRSELVVWVMEDYGDPKSWVKDLEIDYAHVHSINRTSLKPFFFYNGGGDLIKAFPSPLQIRKIFLYRDDDATLEEKDFSCGTFLLDTFPYQETPLLLDSFTYVETLVSPWQPLPICHYHEDDVDQ
ncbi:hypothetical protein C2S53_017530 [Perilla frutescens var. hirtella]|uniref:F-box domain-containing protein n=1 Tax=Perilla frutescens var. hirtella TaxID=608512 RepID=A0AAD4IYR7_PERFH|nr:hypothetical protein C2S53_017530 [Perilla frutescens var. hirtella]